MKLMLSAGADDAAAAVSALVSCALMKKSKA